MKPRLIAAVAMGILVLAACAESSRVESPPTSTSVVVTTTEVEVEVAIADDRPVGPSALDTMFADEFPDPLIDPNEVISGGPPPDGIPPIDDPVFLSVADSMDILPATEPVVALEIDGDARAYPIRALVWHEIVNDTVGGVPVSVTYCPLCNSAATYERTIDGIETTFGTSGRLFASALVMYDRATESLWTHYNGQAVIGVLTGAQLVEHPSPLMAWDDFRTAYPEGQVLDWTQTGFARDYGRNPYTGYDAPQNTPFLFRGALDDRAVAMQRVVGVEHGSSSAAFTLEAVSGGEGQATHFDVGAERVVVFWESGQSSALDAELISEGRDVGSVGVYVPQVDGTDLTFSYDDSRFVDDQTGSVWLATGEAVEGELSGVHLEQLPHRDTFWFAWSTYQPDTTLTSE